MKMHKVLTISQYIIREEIDKYDDVFAFAPEVNTIRIKIERLKGRIPSLSKFTLRQISRACLNNGIFPLIGKKYNFEQSTQFGTIRITSVGKEYLEIFVSDPGKVKEVLVIVPDYINLLSKVYEIVDSLKRRDENHVRGL